MGPDYATAHASLLATGRETVDALLSGDAATPYARLNEELQAAFSEHELQAVLQELHGDRVRFTLHLEGDDGETNAAFDGRLSDGTISGSFAFDHEAPGTFSLERSFSAEPAAPLVGLWTGMVVVGEGRFGITVAFEGEGEELRGTIDVPEVGLSEVALEDLRYEPSVDIGELLAESVLPFSPDVRVYTSEHAWGPSTLVFKLAFDRDGTIIDIIGPFLANLPSP